jgi:hypothetical protein
VHVVRHQAERQDAPAVAIGDDAEAVQVLDAVLVVVEQARPVGSAAKLAPA